MAGNNEAGIYSCMYTISTVIYIVGQSRKNARTPWVYFLLDQKRKKDCGESVFHWRNSIMLNIKRVYASDYLNEVRFWNYSDR